VPILSLIRSLIKGFLFGSIVYYLGKTMGMEHNEVITPRQKQYEESLLEMRRKIASLAEKNNPDGGDEIRNLEKSFARIIDLP